MKKLIAFIFAFACLSFGQTSQVTHGGTGLNSTANNDVLIGTGPSTYTLATLPNCPDSSGNHFNYNSTTHVVTCGTSGNLSAPVSIANGGTGTGSTLTGIVRGGSSAFTAAELSGDCSTSGSNSVTCAKINGNGVPSGAASHQVLVATSANTFSLKTIPDCTDTSGNHLNYTQSGDTFSCGNSTGSGSASTGPTLQYQQCTLIDSTGGGFTSKNCGSTTNVAGGDFLLFTCAIFSNDGGTATLSASDSLGNTWNTILSFYSSQSGERMAAFWASSSSAGADTFTCTSSVSKGFWSIAVNNILGASSTSPVDVSASNQGSNAIQSSASLTTTTANDLAFIWSGTAGNDASAVTLNGFTLFSSGLIGNYLADRNLSVAGTYIVQVQGGNSSWGNIAFALH